MGTMGQREPASHSCRTEETRVLHGSGHALRNLDGCSGAEVAVIAALLPGTRARKLRFQVQASRFRLRCCKGVFALYCQLAPGALKEALSRPGGRFVGTAGAGGGSA